jgi:2-keto-4-pentenoate hydratase
MDEVASAGDSLARLLSTAYKGNSIAFVPAGLEPADIESAYAVQQSFLKHCELETGGWKVGAKSETGPIQGAPLPLPRIYSGHAAIHRRDYPVLGIELEIVFAFNRDFLPRAEPVPEREVLDSVSAFGASVEIVSSRLSGWPEAPKLIQLADLQNHGALVVGQMVEYRNDFAFAAPRVDLRIDGVPLVRGAGSNPAGDPRRLLCWLVNHCRANGLVLPAGNIITTGSYTGMEFPAQAGRMTGEIEGLPAVSFDLI